MELTRQHSPLKICEICGKEFKPNSGVATICDRTHTRVCEVCGTEFVLTKSMYHDKITTCSELCSNELRRRHNIEKYGVDHPMKSSVVKFRRRKPSVAMPSECRDFKKILAQLNISFETDKLVGQINFNIYINNSNILVNLDTNRGPGYNCKLSKIAHDNGFRCVHIFDWDNPLKIAKLVSPARFFISASKCKIYRLKTEPAREFLQNYCLDGFSTSDVLSLGLVTNSTLVAVMTFKSATDSTHTIELSRFATLPEWKVTGAVSKLFKFATDRFLCENVVCYVDKSKFTGKSLEIAGMKKVSESGPRMIWSKGIQMVVDDTLDDKSMLDNRWNQVYDCGIACYEYK